MSTDPYQRPPQSMEGFAEAVADAESLEDLSGLLRTLRRWHARERRDSSLTYQELAEKTGWSRSAIAEYFTARTLPPTDRFDALLEVLGVAQAERRMLSDARDRVEENRRRIGTAVREPRPARGPWQLPADTRLFTGRADEVRTILALADRAADAGPGAVLISAIDGMGGIGKTALAVHVGHRLADRFPDGALFLELHTHTVGAAPRTAFDVQGAALVALGTSPRAIPADPDARAAAYRDRLAGTRTLIVADDADDAAQVRSLLPGTGGCLVLVTSRNRLKALDEAEVLRLDVLPRHEAVELFYKTVGSGRVRADDPAVPRIIQLCESLPLAVRIAGALLRARPAWTPQHLLDDLRENQAGLQGFDDGRRRLPAVLDKSYRHLPDRARFLFRRLAQIPGPDGDSYAAAALMDCDPKAAERLLDLLTDRSMLTEHAAGRWSMHDLLRELATSLAETEDTPEQRQDGLDRLLRYYAYTAQMASVPIARRPRSAPPAPTAPAHVPDITSRESAQAWLRTELRNLDAACSHARTHRLDHHTIALADGLVEILNADGPWALALEIHSAAASAAYPDQPAAHAKALASLGQIQVLVGDHEPAADLLEQALETFRRIGDRTGEAVALRELGRVQYVIGDLQAADHLLEQALEIYERIGSDLGQAATLNDLGRVRCQAADFPRSDEALERSLKLYRQIGDRSGEASAVADLGRVRYLIGDRSRATAAVEQALAMYRRLGDRNGEATVLNDLGQLLEQAGDWQGAAEAHTQAMEICRQFGNRLIEAQAIYHLGRAHHAAGDYQGAADLHAQAQEIFRQLGHRGNKAYALNYYAATVAALGDRPRSLALYEEALAINHELRRPDVEAISLEGIAEHYHSGGDVEKAAAHLRKALETYRRLGMRADIERVEARLTTLGKN